MPEAILPRLRGWSDELARIEVADAATLAALNDAVDNAESSRLENKPSTLLTILLLGPTGSGKSELLNALAGERIAKSHYLRPTTSRPTLYVHREVSQEQLTEYSHVIGELAVKPESCVRHNREELRYKVLIDAPDIDSFRTEHRETVLQLLQVVDVALYVVTPFSYKDNIGWEVMLAQRARRAFAFVLNKWDPEGRPVANEQATEADSDLRELLVARSGYAKPLLFRTSALHWIKQRTGEAADEAPAGDQLLELEKWLSSGLASSAVAQIHARKRNALWLQLARSVAFAVPAKAEWQAWLNQVFSARDGLLSEGRATMKPYLLQRAQRIADVRKSQRPRSIGILGGILSAAAGIGKLRAGVPKIPAPLVEPQGPEDATMGNRLATLVELRLSTFGWAAQQSNLHLGSLLRRWSAATQTIQPQVDASFQVIVDEAIAQQQSRAKRVLAISVSVLLELATLALVGVLVWRVARGYFMAEYAQPSLLLSFFLLFVVLLVLAAVSRMMLFPGSPERIARDLERAMVERWEEIIEPLFSDAKAYTVIYTDLRNRGLKLEEQCRLNANSEIQSMPREHSSDVGRLFANT
jgi:energy-coupling factor transporter ATP-binding protein EcfA2